MKNKNNEGLAFIGIIFALLALFALSNWERFELWAKNTFFNLLLPPLIFLILISFAGIVFFAAFNALKLKYRITELYSGLKKKNPDLAKWLLDQVIVLIIIVGMLWIYSIYRGH